MINFDLLNKLIFINIACFSLLIIIFVQTLKKEPSIFKLSGGAFFSTFFICSFSFVFLENIEFLQVFTAAELSMGISFWVILYFKRIEKNYRWMRTFIFALPILISLLFYQYYDIAYLIFSNRITEVLVIALFIMVILLAKKQKLSSNAFIEGLICLVISFIGRLFENNLVILSFAAIFSVIAYWSFFNYFFKSIHKNLMSKLAEAEKIKASLEDSVNYEVKTRTIAIERSNEQLINIAKTDQLTKAFNKPAILNIIENLMLSRREKMFSVLMFDIDHFKSINDTYGHVVGDVCIKALANIAKANIRAIDYLGRYGGDEFIIVLPNLNLNDARLVGDRFRRKVSESSNPKFTISIGVATFPEDGNTVKDLISAADKGLYNSKGRGRNAISHSSQF